MKNFEIGQKFWDENNCTEAEILDAHGVNCYFCKTLEGACDDYAGKEGRQFFAASELRNMRSI